MYINYEYIQTGEIFIKKKVVPVPEITTRHIHIY